MISIDNLTVSFGGTDLFKDVGFVINERDRIGLVGKNGAGKSTLLKILYGIQKPTSGGISQNGDCTMGYLPQTMQVADGKTVFEEAATAFVEVIEIEKRMAIYAEELSHRTDYESDSYMTLIHNLSEANDRYNMLGGDTREADVEKTLLGLGFERSDFPRPTNEFSGGWRMRIELAKLLLCRPSLFLLDEPTNHLDIESIQWLENYLKDYRGAVVLISHDRAFLNAVTNRTVELLLGKAYDYKVSYSKYVELRRERREQQIAAYNNQQKLIEKTEEFIERFRYKPSKSNQVQSRVKQLDKLERLDIDDEDLSALNIKFPPAPHSGQVVVEAKDAGKSFGDKHVFSGASFTLTRGEKIALVGRNGEGKTTFSKIVIGDLQPSRGLVKLGHGVRVGYYAQNQDDLMNGDYTVFDTLDRVAVGDVRTRLRDILGAFLFRGEEVDKKVKVLSGGERSRLAMARLMLEPYNLLVLDEPTNHMDMRSKDILKSAIKNYNGTVILVSHDREFLDGLVDKVYEFHGGSVKEHLGGIYEFLERKRMQSITELDTSRRESSESPKMENQETKHDYAQKRESDRRKRKIVNDIEETERKIEGIEMDLQLMDEQLAEPEKYGLDISDGKMFEQYSNKKRELNRLMVEWEKLHEESLTIL